MSTGLEQAGDRFGRYIIERRIAVGGMAELFLARLDGPEDFSKRVVIKRILPRLRGNHQFTKMFTDEARLAARFSHPNLVQAFELAQIDDEPMLVMEFIDGKDVGAILKRSQREGVLVPIRIAAYIVGQVAQGLHAAHELLGKDGAPLNVVHRDISPENVLITRLGGVKVIDFGIAKHEARHAETVVGTVKGKVAYMSPEQLLRKKLDRRSDVFSLGVVLYELLTGEQCFKGDSALQQMMAVEKARYTPVHLLRQKVPPDVEAVVDKMLALRPKDRFQSAKEVIAAIERLMSKYGTVLASDLEDYVNPMFETRELPEPVVQKSEEDERWESDVFPLPHADDQSIPEDVKEITLPGDSGGDEIAEARGPKPKAKPNKPKPAPKRANVADTRVKKRRWPLVVASMLVAGVGLGLGALQWVWSGSLDVRTIPPGATVYLDGVAVGQTPTQIDTLRPEVVYELQVELEGYDPIARSVVLEQAQPSALELIHLDPSAPKGAGMLTITSDPPGARVQVVGRSGSEVAPARFVLPAGPAHQLTADLDGFSQANLEVKLDDGERATRRLVLIASFSRLSLNSEPKAEVFVGEKSLGSTPLESVELPAGENILVLRNERLGIEKQLRLDLPPGALLEENVVLSKGTLEFVANPWADVYVDGRKVGTTPMLPLAVYEGAHQVRFVNRDIKKESTVDVIVVAGESTRLNAGWN